MALPVTMYRWDDVGAPQIVDGKPSEYMNVLKKCLVEGYGSKASLGWTIVDDIADPPFLSLRNNLSLGGSGGVGYFSSSDNADGQKVIVEGCQDYIDSSNKVRRSSYFAFDRYSTGAYLIKNWILIGTGKAFYFFCYNEYSMGKNTTSTQSLASFFMGDFNSIYPNDPATFISFSGLRNSTSVGWTSTLNYKICDTSPYNILAIHPLDGSESQGTATLGSIFGLEFKVSGNYLAPVNITAMAPVYILMGGGAFNNSQSYQNNENPFMRGVIPGMYLANSPGYRNDLPPVIKEIDANQHYLIPSTNSNTSCCWINLEEW